MVLCLTFAAATAHAGWQQEDEPKVSTNPIGSPYYRHLAYEMHLDLHQLVKFEKKGFGRTEIVALIMISSSTGKPLRDYGNRRLKDKVTLKQLADEAHIDHAKLIEEARRVKEQIEAMGDKNLPPPIYDIGEVVQPTPAPSPSPSKEKKKKKEKPEPIDEPPPKPPSKQSELD